MKVSIITVCYNSSSTILNAILSVNQQNYENIEHIIVDGLSSDNTLELINSVPNRVVKIISEPDNGIYDAMNKGLALCTGDVIGFLNSDDFYASDDVIKLVADTFFITGAQSIFGDLCYVDRLCPDRIIRYWRSGPYAKNSFLLGWAPPHPTFFVRSEIYKLYGGFDINFRFASDFDLMLNFFEVKNITSSYIPVILVKMRLGGATNNSFINIIKQNIEIFKSFRKYNFSFSLLWFILLKIRIRFTQFLRRDKIIS